MFDERNAYTIIVFNRGIFWIFCALFNTALIAAPSGYTFHCVGGCWGRAQEDCCDYGIGSQSDDLTCRLDQANVDEI
jgi:hypothetical protein